MKTHVTKDGKEIKLCDLKVSHLKNIIRRIERIAEEGYMVITGEAYGFWGDPYGDVDYLYDEQAKDAMGYRYYVDELKRRTE